MARSVAIILMLEGHCTGAALANEYRNTDYLGYAIWGQIHGWTSVLFFTVSGVIFTYLLSAHNEFSYWKNVRVRKGYKRVLQLLFWGYLIQVNLKALYYTVFHGSPYDADWLQAFHVLQGIGFGILMLLVFYGLYKWIGKIELHWYYLIAAAIFFGFNGWLNHRIDVDKQLISDGIAHAKRFWPEGAPKFIQNIIYGQYSEFSILRFTGYTVLGGMLGSIIRKYEEKVFNWSFIGIMAGSGLIILFLIKYFFRGIDKLSMYIGWTDAKVQATNTYPLKSFGVILIFIAFLIVIDKYFKVKESLFLKMGRNTLSIYIVHVIILYEGIFGFGLKPILLNRNFDPVSSGLISLSFISLFVIMVKYIEPLTKLYYKIIPLHWLNK